MSRPMAKQTLEPVSRSWTTRCEVAADRTSEALTENNDMKTQEQTHLINGNKARCVRRGLDNPASERDRTNLINVSYNSDLKVSGKSDQ
jgi:hypothetical protein